ncbi:MAG: Cytochrome b subunit of formate dehydrogenase FdhI [Candidatus Methanohalarchaeum thermophilum]|uniref:Cytochrome b subunit of formate dehydrogenase FdhI n=1 Tax=Methanohalarchaeum thermophilum TaxID=1903181 RepID=A0A1Q6DS59_METT1|nr:MAG: Cytochrome b subunit of formate dehydrogenase FdhI [Candidatus Methanohalarchaeum thermophilum]
MPKKDLIKRYGINEIIQHWVHLIAVIALLITGFYIYYGGGWLEGLFGTRAFARALHLWMAVALFFAWILLAYNIATIFLEGHIGMYLIKKDDLKRMKNVLLSYIGKKDYEAFSIYDEEEGTHETKHAPFWKPFIFIEAVPILIVFFTGVAIWAPNGQFGLLTPAAEIMNSITYGIIGFFAPQSNFLAVARTWHVLAAWYFVFEVIFHSWINLADPDSWEYVKAMFYRGTEDPSKTPYSKVKKKEE